MKKFFTIALSVVLAMAFAAGCTPEDGTDKPDAPNQIENPDDSNPTENPDDSNPSDEPNDADRIIYSENFDNAMFSALGWKVSDVLKDNTADWYIGNGKLIVDNRVSDYNPFPQDSYFVVVPAKVMNEVVNSEEGFTVQWDFEYYDGGDAKRYITLPLFYDTSVGNSYFSYHYRICGYADFQARVRGKWLTLDEEGSEYEGVTYLKSNAREYTDENGEKQKYDNIICKRVFGQEYVNNSEMLSLNQKATIRIEYHPNQYIRVFMNDIYITTSSSSQLSTINELLGIGGTAIAIKAGGTIYGAIDNIVVAKGIGIPETK